MDSGLVVVLGECLLENEGVVLRGLNNNYGFSLTSNIVGPVCDIHLGRKEAKFYQTAVGRDPLEFKLDLLKDYLESQGYKLL